MPHSIRSDQHPVEAFCRLAEGFVRRWQGHCAPTPGRDFDPESIHQIRVTLRSLRSLIRCFEPVLPPAFVSEWKTRLRGISDQFSEARDLEVIHALLLGQVPPEGLIETASFALLHKVVTDAREAARELARKNLDSSVQGPYIGQFSEAVVQLKTGEMPLKPTLRSFARLRLARLRKRARRRFDAATDLAPTRLHEARIAIKELHYATGFFAPLLAHKAVGRSLARLQKAQAPLGFLQDMAVARRLLARLVQADPALEGAAAFVLGTQADHYEVMQRRALRDCEAVLRGRTPW